MQTRWNLWDAYHKIEVESELLIFFFSLLLNASLLYCSRGTCVALKICIICSCLTSSDDKHAGLWLFIKIQTCGWEGKNLTTETSLFLRAQYPDWAAAQILEDTSERRDVAAWPRSLFFPILSPPTCRMEMPQLWKVKPSPGPASTYFINFC